MPRIVRRSAHRRGRRWSIDLNPRVRERPAAPRPPRAGRPATAVSPRPVARTPGPFRRASRRISVASCDRGRPGSRRARVLHCRQHRKNPPRRAGRAEGVLGSKRDRKSPSSGIPDPGAQGSSARTGSLRTRSWRPDEPTPRTGRHRRIIPFQSIMNCSKQAFSQSRRGVTLLLQLGAGPDHAVEGTRS